MENKKTAVEWAFAMLGKMSDEKIKLQAKQMEKEQMIEFAMHLHKVDMSKTGTDILKDEAEQYYKETYANDTTKGLPEEDSKRRGWHY